jgi:hypothetical protein
VGAEVGELPRFEGKARRVVDRAEFAEIAPGAAARVRSVLDPVAS